MTQEEAIAYVQQQLAPVETYSDWFGIEREFHAADRAIRQKIGLRFTPVNGLPSVVVAIGICREHEMPAEILNAHNADLSRTPLTLVDQRLMLRQVLWLENFTPEILEKIIDFLGNQAARLRIGFGAERFAWRNSEDCFNAYAE